MVAKGKGCSCWAGDKPQMVERLPSMYEALGFIPRAIWKRVWWCTPYNPSTQEVITGRSGGQHCPQLYREFEASLGYMRPCHIHVSCTFMYSGNLSNMQLLSLFWRVWKHFMTLWKTSEIIYLTWEKIIGKKKEKPFSIG